MRLIPSSFILVLVLFLFPMEMEAQQDTIVPKKQPVEQKISKKAKELTKALDKNDEGQIAKNYEDLAQQLIDKGDTKKAELYLKRALSSYTRLKQNDNKARVTRNLAKLQESLGKEKEAALNYKAASEASDDKKLEQLNTNDFKRLNNSNTSAKKELLDSNIRILEKGDKKEELSDAYVQKAETSLKSNNTKDAIVSLNKALANSVPAKTIEIKNKIADVYASNNEFDKALSINENLLKEAEKTNDYQTQIKQKQLLAGIYFDKSEPDKAVTSLKEAYALASRKGNTAEVKKSLMALVAYYKKQGNDKESLEIYNDFLENFDTIIQSDTTLIDAKVFQVTEEKIRQLEKEKSLKDELISRKNSFNYMLIAAFFLLLIFFGLIAKALYAIKKKNKEIALQSLRREMNPHFIFNSLNSVNQFISQNKELEANKYLSNYSNLMRNMMENSNKDFVTLSNEIEQLKKYLDLEHLRFHDKFDFKIEVDETLDTDAVFVPNMIIQPHLENAIWHGLRYKETKGLLLLKFELKNNRIITTVDDNGIGLTKSSELKTQNQKVHQSRGVTNTKERIALLNELYKKEITFEIREKEFPETGTIVEIIFPHLNKML
ncbi:tetratricopeptide repeat-containing sensor histidine kinase [Flavobacterium sp.]